MVLFTCLFYRIAFIMLAINFNSIGITIPQYHWFIWINTLRVLLSSAPLRFFVTVTISVLTFAKIEAFLSFYL